MKKKGIWTILWLLFFMGFLASLAIGRNNLTIKELIAALLRQGTTAQQLIVYDFRMPRLFVSIFAGAGLAVSGYLFQTITHNDLADPGILGINSGAGLLVLLYLGFFSNQQTTGFLPIIACLGSFIAAILVYICGKQRQRFDSNRLLLAGVAVNAGISAITLLATVQISTDSYRFVTAWLSGTIWGTTWKHVGMLAPGIFVILPFILLQGKHLEVIELGDEEAIGLGVPLRKKQIFFLCCAIILAAISVSVAGSISFIGLIAPHIAKGILQRKNNQAILMTAMIGTLILLYSDVLGRILLPNGEMAAGIIVSIIGAPYFIFQLLKKSVQ
ncbi:MAG TPA: iron ABC transporter permease [Candidatus Tetragenococcus pullicola]|nr:iron ABC transporter permease [Candidatus Tetragenococcus pullicola]